MDALKKCQRVASFLYPDQISDYEGTVVFNECLVLASLLRGFTDKPDCNAQSTTDTITKAVLLALLQSAYQKMAQGSLHRQGAAVNQRIA